MLYIYSYNKIGVINNEFFNFQHIIHYGFFSLSLFFNGSEREKEREKAIKKAFSLNFISNRYIGVYIYIRSYTQQHLSTLLVKLKNTSV